MNLDEFEMQALGKEFTKKDVVFIELVIIGGMDENESAIMEWVELVVNRGVYELYLYSADELRSMECESDGCDGRVELARVI